MPPDVLHVLPSAQRRGAETFGYDLNAALAQRGVANGDLVSRAGPRRQDTSGASVCQPQVQPGWHPGANHRFSLVGTLALRRRAADAAVVVAHGSSTLLACGLGLIGLGVPFVYLSIGDPGYWAMSPARRLRIGWLIRRASAVVAISPTAREVLVGFYSSTPNAFT